MKYIDVMGKTIEGAIAEGLAQLGTSSDKVEVSVLKQPGMFSKAKVRITVVDDTPDTPVVPTQVSEVREDVVSKAEPVSEQPEVLVKVDAEASCNADAEYSTVAGKILADICHQISPSMKITESQKEKVIVYQIEGEGSDRLIGKNGACIDSLQLVLNSINRHKEPSKPYIVVRIDEYEQMKEKKLEKIAVDSANKAIEINNTVRLEVMNSYERRIVHSLLQKDERVVTESFGVEPYRYITVRPKDKE